MNIRPMPLVSLLAGVERKKGLILLIYRQLMVNYQDIMDIPGRKGWEMDLGVILEEEWQSILKRAPLVSLTSTQCLSKLFIIYRTYRTPVKLYKWRRRETSECPWCEQSQADLLHMLWKCPKLSRYWQEVVSTIKGAYNIQIEMESKTCLLGYLKEELYPRKMSIPIGRLLFIARRLIARK